MDVRLEANEMRAWTAFLECGERVRSSVERQLRLDGGLTQVEYEVLARLSESIAPLTMSELAERMICSKSGLTYTIDKMSKRGLVGRTVDAKDRRSFLLLLTPSGRALLEQIAPGHIVAVKEAFSDGLADDEVDVLAGLLERIAGRLRPAGRSH